jgi:hypothetical protein
MRQPLDCTADDRPAPTSQHGRRDVLKLAAAALASVVVGAHTPYGQWTVYRQRNLFIVASRTDSRALLLARMIVHGLARELPEASARVTRASDPVRIASLLATGQLDVAIVSRQDASGMIAGSDEFRAVGPVILVSLAEIGRYELVAVESFNTRHAYLLAQAIDHMRAVLPPVTKASPIPTHPGALIYLAGRGLPAQDAGDNDRSTTSFAP